MLAENPMWLSCRELPSLTYGRDCGTLSAFGPVDLVFSTMTEKAEPQRVFVSYVREDAEQVDGLCRLLEAAGIPYWRDRTSLAPGDAWKDKIRSAIRSGSLVFLACFSEASRSREGRT